MISNIGSFAHKMKIASILAWLNAVCVTHATLISRRTEQPISVPTRKPDDAFVIPKDFVGFGIESAFFPHFNNDFSSNLVSSVASRMSAPPIMRVGGTSGDYFKYDPAQEEDTVCYNGTCGSHEGWYSLGPSYFDAYRDQFQNAKFIVQAPIGPVDKSNRLAYVWNAWQALDDGDRVEAIALGNEVEFIYKAGAKAYVNAALGLQESVIANLSLSGGAAGVFEAGNTASGTIKDSNLYRV